jgi:hypothetical protein
LISLLGLLNAGNDAPFLRARSGWSERRGERRRGEGGGESIIWGWGGLVSACGTERGISYEPLKRLVEEAIVCVTGGYHHYHHQKYHIAFGAPAQLLITQLSAIGAESMAVSIYKGGRRYCTIVGVLPWAEALWFFFFNLLGTGLGILNCAGAMHKQDGRGPT